MSTIIRAPRPPRGYFEVQNTTARDPRLSYRARGILVRLLSNADGFGMTAADLAREGKEGRGAILTALKELRQAGYLVTTRKRVERGRWITESIIYDAPQTTEV